MLTKSLTAPLVFYRTYSRRLSTGLRESWLQMVDRCTKGLIELGKLTPAEADLIRYCQLNFTALTSGRWQWVGGTDWVSKPVNVSGSYNCSNLVIDSFNRMALCMDLLMQGCGVGTIIETDIIAKLPKITTRLELEVTGQPGERSENFGTSSHNTENTLIDIRSNRVLIIVGDSRQGWVDAYEEVLNTAACNNYTNNSCKLVINLSHVRAAGAPIKGFGGVSNPVGLKHMFERMVEILNGAVGRQLNSVEVTLLLDEPAKAVVAGNVRRCIAYGERVSAFGGMKQIQDIQVGDLVLASDGKYHSVTDKFDQGVQKTIKIKTQLSSLSVTPNHRLAVMDKLNSYKWVEAKDLSIGDILVSTPHTKGVDTITTDEAWLIGTYIADGHTDIESVARRNGGGGTTVFALSTTNLDTVGAKIVKCLFDKGYTPTVRSNGNSSHIAVYRKDLAEYFRQFKAPWGTPVIPNSIWHGSPQVRGAFLAGLWDGDGDDRAVLNSTKPEFLADVQKLYLSLGIAVNLNIRKNKVVKGSTYEGCHNLTVVGQQSKLALKALVAPFLVRIKYVPCGMNRSNLRLPKFFSTKHMNGKSGHNWDGLVADGIADASLIPCPIVSISDGDSTHTYDIEVADVHEFIVNGVLSHNSANIRQFSADDELAATAKDNLWIQEGDRWLIDPKRDALRMSNHTRVFHYKPTLEECTEAIQKQYNSGEGAIQWAGEAVARANADLLTDKKKKQTFISEYEISRDAAREYLEFLIDSYAEEPIDKQKELDHRMMRYGLNPCAEVILNDNFCNLSEVHLNQLDPSDLTAQSTAFKAAALSACALLHHNFIDERMQYSREIDPIVGVSFTGLFDFFVNTFGVGWLRWWQAGRPEKYCLEILPRHTQNVVSCCNTFDLSVDRYFANELFEAGLFFTNVEQEYLEQWRSIVESTVAEYCDRHGIKKPNRCTLVQPAGSKSLLTGASCGWHPPKAARFIRRITFAKNDPVALAAIDCGYSVIPSQSDKDENGDLLNDPFDPRCTEWLVEVPIAANWADLEGVDEIDISQFSALAQFDFYMQVQQHYSRHTTSATIEFRQHEIEPLAKRVYEAIRDDEGYISAALLARFDDKQTYPRLPFEPIDKFTYERHMSELAARRKFESFDEALAYRDASALTESVLTGPIGCDSDKCLLPERPKSE